ncbi:MAG: tetratricopeptide repeat protein [Gammaproteobacteria bacterium]|nr:tetratricopeptide repeat protein [Gammaproteobacteria bacterium]
MAIGANAIAKNKRIEKHEHIEFPMPEEAKQRGHCIVNTPHLFYELQPWGAIPKSNPNFVERGNTLAELKAIFSTSNRRGGHHQANVDVKLAQGIVGFGGVGKTQLAREYVRRLCDEEEDENIQATERQSIVLAQNRRYALKLWLRGEKILLADDLRKLVDWLGLAIEPNTPIQNIAQRVYERLAHLSPEGAAPRVLLVIDDGHWEEGLKALLPDECYRHRFHWLLTSREQLIWKEYFGQTYHPCRLDIFTEDEADAYFDKAFSKEAKAGADYTPENRALLARQLESLPLALAQAVAYINQQCHRGEGIQDYLAVLEQRALHLDFDQKVEDYTRPVITTWLISLHRLLAESPTAVELLLACGYLSGAHIPLGLLRAYKGDIQGEDALIKATVLKAVECLVNYSLLEDTSPQTVKIHTLLQEVLRGWLGGQLLSLIEREATHKEIQLLDEMVLQRTAIKKEGILPTLAKALTEHAEEWALTVEEVKRRIALIPHLEALIIHWEATALVQEKENHVILYYLYKQLGTIQLYLCGDANVALDIYQYALLLAERHYGKDNLEIAIALENLGNAYGDLGDATQQKALQERALVIQERHYGPDHPEVAITLVNLGNAYGTSGDASRKKALQERALVIQERHYGLDHPEVAATLVNLGSAYGALGDMPRAKELLERALVIQERYYGKDYPRVATTLNNLGSVYGALGDATRSKELLERALVIQESYFGPDHPEVAITLNNLGNVNDALRDASQQKALQERALVIQERYYGKDHPGVVITLENLGSAYGALGDMSRAKELLERALVIQESYFGKDHPAAAKTRVNVGDIYCRLGSYLCRTGHIIQAIESYEQSITINPEKTEIYHNLACCYFTQGEFDKADTCFQTGIAFHLTPGILAEYSHFLVKQKRFNEAMLYLQQCLAYSEDGKLSYSLSDINTVVPAIQQMIKTQPAALLFFSAKGLAFYLQACCHLEVKSDDLAITQSLTAFEELIKVMGEASEQSSQAIQQASYYFLLGDIYEKCEDITQARFYYRKACQLNEHFTKIIKIPLMKLSRMHNNPSEIFDVESYYPSDSPIHSYRINEVTIEPSLEAGEPIREKGATNISEEEDRASAINDTINSNSEDEFPDKQTLNM